MRHNVGMRSFPGKVTVDSESIVSAYQRYAAIYDWVFGAIFHPGRKQAIDLLECQSGDRILEVAVGTGLSLPLYPESCKVVGIDLSEAMLKKAQQKVKSRDLEQVESLHVMNAETMDFPDDSFDSVAAMYVASVVQDRQKLMSEIFRVCKPGGRIVLLNHFSHPNSYLSAAENILEPLSKYLGFYPNVELQAFCEETGFQPDQEIPVNLFNYWTILFARNKKDEDS